MRPLWDFDPALFDPARARAMAERVPRARGQPATAQSWSPIEATVAGLWCEVLHVAPAAHDEFFELGGHSLDMIRLISKIHERLGIAPDVDAFFAKPTVAEHAVIVRDGLVAQLGPEVVAELVAEARRAAAADVQRSSDPASAPFGPDATQPPAARPTAIAAPLKTRAESRPHDAQAEAATPDQLRALATTVERAERSQAGAAITTLAVLHCGAPERLERALTSHLEAAAVAGRRIRLLVVDDSKTSESRRAARECVASLRRRRGASISFADADDKQRFGARLVERGAPPEAVAFALFGPRVAHPLNTVGANRNAVLLETAGEAVLCCDDDVVHALVVPRPRGDGIAIASAIDPASYGFFDDAAACFSATPCGADLFAAHEELLGKRAVSALATLGWSGEPIAATGMMIDRLRRGAAIRATLTGVFGDCGWGSPSACLTTPFSAETITSLADAGAYGRARTSRYLVRAVERPVLADAAWFMTYAVALDNRRWLPPHLPVLRGEDVLFGRMLWALDDEGCIGHVPLAIRHDPPARRPFRPREVLRSATGFDFYELIIACLDERAEAAGEGALASTGETLTALADFDLDDFTAWVRDRMTRSRERLVHELERRHRVAPKGAWADDVARYAALVQRRIEQDDPWTPLDLMGQTGASPEATMRLAREIAIGYGELLKGWPTIVEIARELHERGDTLARGDD